MRRILRNILCMLPGMGAGALLWMILLPARRKRLARRGLASGRARECAMLLFWMFSGGMAVITLVPTPEWLFLGLTQGVWHLYFNASGLARRVNLMPFSQMDGLFNIIGNIVMFLPFGFFLSLLWRKCSGKRAIALGWGITCGIECWQIFLGRVFDTDDIILNTLGVFCGYLLWVPLRRIAPGWTRRFHVMEILELVVPGMAYKEEVMAYKSEMLESGDSFDGCNGLNEVETYEEWLDFRGREERKGWQPSHTWLAVRKSDGRVVGIVNYRSPLTDFLLQYGGNIGYCIRPGERRKGYAKEMLRLALEECRRAGEEKVLLTCDKGNLGSERTILANGGVLENEVADIPGLGKSGVLRRYWITL